MDAATFERNLGGHVSEDLNSPIEITSIMRPSEVVDAIAQAMEEIIDDIEYGCVPTEEFALAAIVKLGEFGFLDGSHHQLVAYARARIERSPVPPIEETNNADVETLK